MADSMRTQLNRFTVVILLLLVSAKAIAQRAEDIYQLTGIQGGLVVHLQCGDGKLTADLGRDESYLVQGLDTDQNDVDRARQYIESRGRYGQISVIPLCGTSLPYNSNLVNLIVGQKPTGISTQEIMRVLVPNGVAYLKEGSTWTLNRKPASTQTDDWTHYLHGPDNNAVSNDTVVSHPYHVQWVGSPKWTRHHNHLNSFSALVSAKGRIFYILDEGPLHSMRNAPQWRLIARDAYNGVVLWKKSISLWESHLRPFRSGPTELPRRLVAVGDRVYVTLGYDRPLSVLDAATGRLVQEVPGTEGTCEIICAEDQLFLVAGETQGSAPSNGTGVLTRWVRSKRLIAVDRATHQLQWGIQNEDTQDMLPTTLCANKTGVYFHSPKHLIRLDRVDGRIRWKIDRPLEKNRLAWGAPTLALYKDLVLCAEGKHLAANNTKNRRNVSAQTSQPAETASETTWTITARPRSGEGGQLIVYRTQDGRELWRCPAAFGYSSPPNLLIASDLVWVNSTPGINRPDMGQGRNPHTGEIVQTIDMEFTFDAAHHHRCYRDKATNDFMMLGRTGVEFVNLKNEAVQRHYWIRGTCQYGIMPANGLLYIPGHSCACYVQSKLNGLWALGPRQYDDTPEDETRLLKGSAYGRARPDTSSTSEDWPTLRHDVHRSSATSASPNPKPQLSWRTPLNAAGGLTSPVIVGNHLVTALKDSHEVVCLNADTGEVRWRYRVGGRIDSPPTLYRGMALVGSHDGYVTCLDLENGELVWTFRAAPGHRQTVAHGQVESVWPVVGSVLVHEGELYCTAGRSSYIDGGITLFVLDPKTGEEINRNRFYSRDTKSGQQPDGLLEDVELPGTLPDVLTVKGDGIFLRDKILDAMGREAQPGVYEPHLYSSAGLLDDNWWHRTTWIWGERSWGRASGWAIAGRHNPSGRLLATEGDKVYGYKFADTGKEGHELFCADKAVEKVNKTLKNNNAAVAKYVTPDKPIYHWRNEIDIAVRAMLLTPDAIYAAGPAAAEVLLFDKTATEAYLSVYSKAVGIQISKTKLPAQPVFDGMAAANSRVFVALINGEIVCYR